jgi:hypothetical protein
MEIYYADGTKELQDSLELTSKQSKKIFHRTGEVAQVVVFLGAANLR